MTRTSRRQALLLAGLAVVLLVVIWKQFGGTAPATPSRQSSKTAGPAASAVAITAAPDVQIERLTRDDDETLPPSVRNPFRFRERPVAPPVRSGTIARPTVPQPPVAMGPPPPPPIPLRFIGVVEPRAGAPRIAVFASTDVRGDVLYGKEGDIIEGRYRVLRVGPDTAELAYVDGRGRQTIRLSGQ